MPLTCLGWPLPVYESLYGMGISRVGDCLRLPRQGFAKRFGVSRLLELDRAVGRLPDPRVSYRTPEYFVADHDLEEELSNSDFVCADCIKKANCYVESHLSWYVRQTCWVCSKNVKTMRVQFITIKENEDE